MASLKVESQDKEVLEVDFGGHVFNIPLASSLPYSVVRNLKTTDDALKFLDELIPEEVSNIITLGELKTILDEWIKASKMGESSASQSLSENTTGQ